MKMRTTILLLLISVAVVSAPVRAGEFPEWMRERVMAVANRCGVRIFNGTLWVFSNDENGPAREKAALDFLEQDLPGLLEDITLELQKQNIDPTSAIKTVTLANRMSRTQKEFEFDPKWFDLTLRLTAWGRHFEADDLDADKIAEAIRATLGNKQSITVNQLSERPNR